jgi:hypothetical protein
LRSSWFFRLRECKLKVTIILTHFSSRSPWQAPQSGQQQP